jgi:DNA modification methylase
VSVIITSPPYALKAKKAYGNLAPGAYVDWFLTFVPEFRRVLRPDGSIVIEIGGAWNPGLPTRSIYHFELLVRLVNEAGFHLAEEFFWFSHSTASRFALGPALLATTAWMPESSEFARRGCVSAGGSRPRAALIRCSSPSSMPPYSVFQR